MNWTALALIVTLNPVTIYFSVKWGRFGYLRANEAFDKYQKSKSANPTT